MKQKLVQYEKIITINDESFQAFTLCFLTIMNFIEEKCKNDDENLDYFQCTLTDSERSIFSKDFKIKWAVTKNEK